MTPDAEEELAAKWGATVPTIYRPGHRKANVDNSRGAIIASEHGPPSSRLLATCRALGETLPKPEPWQPAPRGERTKLPRPCAAIQEIDMNEQATAQDGAAKPNGANHAPRTRGFWTAEERAEIIAEVCAPGAVLTTVARQHGVKAATLYDWKRKHVNGATPAMPVTSAPDKPIASALDKVTIALDEPAMPPMKATVEARLPQAIEVIEIEAGAIRVRIPANEAMAATIMRALLAGCRAP